MPHSECFHYIDAVTEGNLFQMTVKKKRSLPADIFDFSTGITMEQDNVVPSDVFQQFTVTSWQHDWKTKEWMNIFVNPSTFF